MKQTLRDSRNVKVDHAAGEASTALKEDVATGSSPTPQVEHSLAIEGESVSPIKKHIHTKKVAPSKWAKAGSPTLINATSSSAPTSPDQPMDIASLQGRTGSATSSPLKVNVLTHSKPCQSGEAEESLHAILNEEVIKEEYTNEANKTLVITIPVVSLPSSSSQDRNINDKVLGAYMQHFAYNEMAATQKIFVITPSV
ncbi:hypothetical protein ACFE04_011210 [Oxalis oulophora]